MTMLVLMGMQQTVDAEIRNMDLVATVVGVGGTAWALKLRSAYKAVEAQAAKLKKNKASMSPEEYKTAMSNLHEEYVQLKRRYKQVAYTTGTVVAAYAAYRGYQWRVEVAEAAVRTEQERIAAEAAQAARRAAARAPGGAVGVPAAAAGGRGAAAAPARPAADGDLAAIRWEAGGEDVVPADGGALMAGLVVLLQDPGAQAAAVRVGAAIGGAVAVVLPIIQELGDRIDAALVGGVPAAGGAPAAAAPALGGPRVPVALGDSR